MLKAEKKGKEIGDGSLKIGARRPVNR